MRLPALFTNPNMFNGPAYNRLAGKLGETPGVQEAREIVAEKFVNAMKKGAPEFMEGLDVLKNSGQNSCVRRGFGTYY